VSGIRFSTFPRTQPPSPFVCSIIEVFRRHEPTISTLLLAKGLTSDAVLAQLRDDLVALGFDVEAGKHTAGKIKRPVFFGENGKPDLQYEIDAYSGSWRCGLEVEAGRALMGNAVYRDIVQALVMVELDHLVLAVPNGYRYQNSGKDAVSRDYENTVAVADALYGHSRIRMPFGLTVIGY
jgi:hypothetical protein